MTLTITLTVEQEATVRNALVQNDDEAARQVIMTALNPAIERMKRAKPFVPKKLTSEEFDVIADQIADEFASDGPTPTLDLSREGIYGIHP